MRDKLSTSILRAPSEQVVPSGNWFFDIATLTLTESQMIPQRKLTRSGFGNGVSCRIEACRRRLRTVRANEAPGRVEELTTNPGFASAGLNVAANTEDMSRQGPDEAEIT